MTYMDYTCLLLEQMPTGTPIYINRLASDLAEHFSLDKKQAAAATSVAVKRIMDGNLVPDLRFYQKGIYYRTVVTPFGEKGIDKEKLIADKYLLPDKGYETGLALLHRLGLATQMPREHLIATNIAKECVRTDKKLGVTIKPPKVKIDADNKAYLQTLAALELLDKAPDDAEEPYQVMAKHIKEYGLHYGKLLFFADRYYNKNTIMQLAHTASEGVM